MACLIRGFRRSRHVQESFGELTFPVSPSLWCRVEALVKSRLRLERLCPFKGSEAVHAIHSQEIEAPLLNTACEVRA